jgi:hypothetical protein
MTARRIDVGFAAGGADSPSVRRLVPFVLFVLLAGACGDDDDAAPPTTAQPTTTTEPATTTTEEPTTTTCPSPDDPDVAGLVDLDGDGVDEVWRHAGSGASVQILELHRLVGCVEEPVLLDGVRAQFAIGGTVTHLDGIRCDRGTVVHLNATSEDGESYATSETRYELEGDSLVPAGAPSTGAMTTSDPDLADFATFTCAG